MTYSTFQNQLVEELSGMVGEDCDFICRVLKKNNGVEEETMMIREKEENMSPVIYLEPYYRQAEQGVPIRHIAKMLYQDYREISRQPFFTDDFLSDYGNLSLRIFCKLINYEKNKERLAVMPCERRKDLAVIYYYLLPGSEDYHTTFEINRDIFSVWGIPEEELRRDAWANTMRRFPAKIESLTSVLNEVCSDSVFEEEDSPLLVLSNEKRYLGSVCLCYPGIPEMVAAEVRGNYYVLPSSIHECLILPDTGEYQQEGLDRMVRDINETQVMPQEVLSDHAYYYSVGKGFI